jgi:hypothetical protein
LAPTIVAWTNPRPTWRDGEIASRKIEGERLFRLASGYRSILDGLRSGIDPRFLELRTRTVVSAVTWQPDKVQVESHSLAGMSLEPCHATRLIVTLPLGVLQALYCK